ncbi:MAG: ATP-binding cassette domain-containing protein [Bacteroidota bacterium]|nr:ATP-binding cassette domain-containing protein [Bacteroidota bacterium]
MNIEINNLYFNYSYPATTVLENVNLKINSGEVVALMGNSGCGKSTLLQIISTLIKPTKGIINFYINDKKQDNNQIMQNLAYVTQDSDKMLFPWLTVEENLYYPNNLRNRLKCDGWKDHCDKILDDLKISHKRKNYPNKISGGERKRLSIAVALSYKPNIILMDEPLTGIDFKLTQELWDFLYEDFQIRNPTVLFVTHSLDEASILADRVVYFKEKFKSIWQPKRDFFYYEKVETFPRHELLKHEKVKEYKDYLLDEFKTAIND